MKLIFRTVLAFLSIISILEASPPPEVIERLGGAETALESGHFVGNYTLSVSSVVAKADGSKKKTSDMEMMVEIEEGGEERRRLVRFLVDGEDQTEKNREDLESPPEDDDDDEDKGEGNDDFLAPFGEHAGRFVFGTATPREAHVEMTFEPARGHEEDNGITSGTMAWTKNSLDPLWLEMEVLEPQKPMRELKVRMEFQRVGENVYMSRMVTDGRVKLLLMKRNFHMEMVVRGVEGLE